MTTIAHSRAAATAVGALSLAPALAFASIEPSRSLALAVTVLVAAALLRGGARVLAPELGQGYALSRLCSLRYTLPALGVPALGGAAIARFGLPALTAVLVGQLVLAQRYRACWVGHGVLKSASAAALLGGVHVALECLALRGPELALRGRLLYAERNPRQRIALLEQGGALELLIDGELQFRSSDEQLYHQGLLAPALALLAPGAHVLVLGGGDGLAARDLLRSERVARITIVDWDPSMTRLFGSEPRLRALNGDALRDPRVAVVHRDVRELLLEPSARFDLIVGDLTDPDPAGDGAALCSSAFYLALRAQLKPGGMLVTHTSSSDGSAVHAIPHALEQAGFHAHSYAVAVPSFQRVTYVLATQTAIDLATLPPWAAGGEAGQATARAALGTAAPGTRLR